MMLMSQGTHKLQAAVIFCQPVGFTAWPTPPLAGTSLLLSKQRLLAKVTAEQWNGWRLNLWGLDF